MEIPLTLSRPLRARVLSRTIPVSFYLRELRWDKWIPKDPATLAEVEEREEEEDQKRTKEFEESNPDFCKTMVDDMKARSEARWAIFKYGKGNYYLWGRSDDAPENFHLAAGCLHVEHSCHPTRRS